MGYELTVPFQDVEKMALAVAKSGLFGMTTPEAALSLMLLAQAEGIHPMTAARDYHIIKGRPSLKADAIMARFQNAGGVVKWVERTDKKVSAYFSHPSCPDPILIDWDFDRARQAGLGGKDNWKNYPRQMLTARVISEGVRATYPGACAGVYTPEEVQDFSDPIKHEAPKAEPVKNAIHNPFPEKATDAEIVPVAPAEPFKLSDKTIHKFGLCKSFLNGQFEEILKNHGFNAVEEIKSEEAAKNVLRGMRVAIDSLPKAVAA